MFSTNSIASVLGLSPEDVQYKSFYKCIQETSLGAAVSCLENAKANDSIAYLRFWSRDPCRPEGLLPESGVENYSGPVHLVAQRSVVKTEDENGDEVYVHDTPHANLDQPSLNIETDNLDDDGITHQLPPSEPESTSSQLRSPATPSEATHTIGLQPRMRQQPFPMPSIECEAVVPCTSDGLVVVLRRARPALPSDLPEQSEPITLCVPRHGQQNPCKHLIAPRHTRKIFRLRLRSTRQVSKPTP
jgi:hypothetical protein